MPPRNVLPFKSSLQAPGWEVRVFPAIFYVAMAALLYPVHSGSLTVVMIPAILYWMFLQRRIQRGNYLQQNRLLLMVLLVVGLILFWQVVLPMALLVGLFWLMIWRVHGEAPYFVRYHVLTALVLNLSLVLILLVLAALLEFVGALWALGPGLLLPLQAWGIESPLELLGLLAIWGSAVYLAIAALMGRTPFIPFVSAQVRHWA